MGSNQSSSLKPRVAGNCNGEGIPEWLEQFTENLEDTEVLANADISHDSDPERPFRVASRKHGIFYSLPKRSKLRSMLANQEDKGSLQKTNWKFSTLSIEFCDFITADHKVLNEEVNQGTIIDTRSWYKI